MKDRPRYEQIDALKGIAIFLVVLGHSIILYPIDLHQNAVCANIFRLVTSVHMPLFFVISGFCYTHINNFKTFLIRKLKRLIVPYMVFNMIDTVCRTILPFMVNRPRNIAESIYKIIFCGGEYWFLYVLFIIFMIYPFIDNLLKNHMYRYIVLIVCLLALYTAMPTIELFLIDHVVYYMLYFVIGRMIRERYGASVLFDRGGNIKNALAAGIMIIGWGGLTLINYDFYGRQIITALAGITVMCLFARYKFIIFSFKRFGKFSLQIYLLNGFLLVASRTIIVRILGVSSPAIIIAFNMLIDFFVSYMLIKYIFNRYKWIRLAMGSQ